MIQLDGVPLPYESCLEVPGVELIPEEEAEVTEGKDEGNQDEEADLNNDPKSPDSVVEIRGLINPVLEVVLPASERNQEEALQHTQRELRTGTVITEDGLKENITHVTTKVETVSRKSTKDKSSPQNLLQELRGVKKHQADKLDHAAESVAEETELQKGAGERAAEVSAATSGAELAPDSPLVTDSGSSSDGGFQTPASKAADEV